MSTTANMPMMSERLLYDLAQELPSKEFEMHVSVNFAHWVPIKPVYVVRVSCQVEGVTMETAESGDQLDTTFGQAAKRLGRVARSIKDDAKEEEGTAATA